MPLVLQGPWNGGLLDGSDEKSDAGGSFEMMVLKSVMPVVNIGIEWKTSP